MQKICVSIIIPYFERAREIKRLLISLKNLTFPELFEIIVVDDGSKNKEEIQKILEDAFPTTKYQLIRLDKNVGPSKARNIGIKKAQGEFLWFLDSDTEAINPNLLKILVNCLRKNSNLAGVGGEYIKMNDKIYIIKNHLFPNWLLLTKSVQTEKSFEFHPKIISTSNMLIKKKDFLATNGFLAWLSTHEDNDLCLQLSRSGKTFLIRDDTTILHHHSSSGRDDGTFNFYNKMWKYILVSHLNRVKILFLHFPWRILILPLLDIIFSPIVFFYQLLFSKIRTNALFKEKSKDSSHSFIRLVLFNLMSIIWVWIYGYSLMFKSLIYGRQYIINSKNK